MTVNNTNRKFRLKSKLRNLPLVELLVGFNVVFRHKPWGDARSRFEGPTGSPLQELVDTHSRRAEHFSF